MQGKTINGFTLQYLLGAGGMAEVWYAENKIGKKAAVKILLPKFCQDENVVSRFITEAKVMVDLDHPNIREVYDYGDIDGRPAIVMEYLEGDDLKARTKRGQRFSDEELQRWWNQLVDALNYTHQKGIIHRDIKPGNIFVDREGNVKLLDFGIAKVRESISRTQTGQRLGTLMYMSPEQVRDSKRIDYHTDIYSLAVTFVHLITGKKPYNSDTTSDFEISEKIVYKPLDLNGVPETWKEFLTPYLAKEPTQRPALRYFDNTNESDDEETFVENLSQKPESEKPTKKAVLDSNSNKTKSKKGLWIGLSVGAAAVLLLLVLLLKPQKEPVQLDPDTIAYQACNGIEDLRNYMNDFGRKGLHYDEAKALVAEYLADSIAKVQAKRQAEAKALAAKQQAEAEAQAKAEDEKKEEAAYKKCTTIEGCNTYLISYPKGKYVKEVKRKKADLEEAESETVAELIQLPESVKKQKVFTFYFSADSDDIPNNSYNKAADNALLNLVSTYSFKGFEIRGSSLPDELLGVGGVRANAAANHMKAVIKKSKKNANRYSYKAIGVGVDWNTLFVLIEASGIRDKEAIVANLRNSSNKEKTISQMCAVYPEIEREILPMLRRVEVYVY